VCHSKRMMDFSSLDRRHPQSLTKQDFVAVDRLYSVLGPMLAPDTTGRLPTALRYYQQAFRVDIDRSVRFLGMMMGMEALFSPGATEVSHQVPERAAFFLKQTAQERESLYDLMKDLYGTRSSIAHGRTASGRKKDLSQAFRQLVGILQDSLVKVLGDPTLTDLFQDSKSEHINKAMKSLIFGMEMKIK
jgi:hypothetical protein